MDEDLKALIEERASEIESTVSAFRSEMLSRLETAKNNEILTSIKALNARLDRIEGKLGDDNEA